MSTDPGQCSFHDPALGNDDGGWGDNISRGYTEEMEHFCYAVRTQGPDYYPDGKPLPREQGGLRCNGITAMADAMMAITANRAMALKTRIEFQPEWFDRDSERTPEADHPLPGEDPQAYMA